MTNTTQKPVDWTKPVQYRNGKKCTVLTTTCPGNYPVVTHDEDGQTHIHLKCGSGVWPRWDILNIPEEVFNFINIYNASGGVVSYLTKENADEKAHPDRTAILKITFVDSIPTKSEIIPV